VLVPSFVCSTKSLKGLEHRLMLAHVKTVERQRPCPFEVSLLSCLVYITLTIYVSSGGSTSGYACQWIRRVLRDSVGLRLSA
jgi:hypothetical protein